MQDKSVSLVLGAGGARGLAHIGVIRQLEQAGARIEAIAGSSMGALVGGIFAAGKLDAYEEWVCSLTRSDVLSLIDWTFSGGGLIKGRKIVTKLSDLVGQINIDELDIDFTAVAVDINQGREVWLDRGPLFDAVRASIAIPGLFTPHHYRDRTLVDGGILNPIPVAPTLRHMTDLTVVVDVNGPPDLDMDQDDHEQASDSGSLVDRLKEVVDRFSGDREPEASKPGLFDIMLRALDTMQAALTRQHLAIFQPDLVIRVPKNIGMVHEFHRAREFIDLGATLAKRAIEIQQFNNGEQHAGK